MAGKSTALQGAPELIAKLQAIGGLDNNNAIRAAVRAGMQPVLRVAKANAPVSSAPHKVYTGDTVLPGFARDSLHIISAVSGTQVKGLLGPSKKAYYITAFVERGTSRAPAYPFIVPALYSQQDNAQRAMVVSLQAFFDKVSKQ
jgi:HK97 gp10 family phage protein